MMQTIKVSDYGVVSGTDVTLVLNALFQTYTENTIFEFDEGDYYFYPHKEMEVFYNLSNTDAADYRTLGIWLKSMKNCTLNGNGARLWFAGHMQPITMDRCSELKVQGFTIDWEKPLVAEGVVLDCGENWVKLFVDDKKFPHRFVNDWLEFDVGAGEWYPLCEVMNLLQYEPDSMCIRRNTADNFLLHPITVEGKGIYKIPTTTPYDGAAGNIVVLRHNMRLHAGIFTEMCDNISIENIVFHSCGGLGCLSQFCHNVRYESIHFAPNTKLGRRVVNGRDDGMHITSNSGKVEIVGCSFIGLMDDPINVHGCCVAVDEVLDSKTLRCSYRHPQATGFSLWAKAGDEISLIDRKDMSSMHLAKVSEYHLETAEAFTISFQEVLPTELLKLLGTKESVSLENLTNTPEFYCARNRFGSCRARGVLVSTPKTVVIENNYFESSGAAILVAGDSNYWFESGACRDVTIRNNVFTNRCNGSDYEFCQGVISICPVVPEPEKEKPFHHNIKICNNVFDVACSNVVYAFSCEGLQVKDNLIFQSPMKEWKQDNNLIEVKYCRDVLIENNQRIGWL